MPNKEPKHSLKVGDILKCSWGYDQTNIDFYQVTQLIGVTMVEVRPVGQQPTDEPSGPMSGYCKPRKDAFIGEPTRHRVTDGTAIRINSYSWARKTNPEQSSYWSCYA
jgi:hypothetical protein